MADAGRGAARTKGARREGEGPRTPAPSILVNGESRALPDERSVGGLLAALSLPAEWVLVELNGEPVPRERYATTTLSPGDRLELATPMAGG